MSRFPRLIFSGNFIYILLIAAETAAIVFLCLYIPALLPYAVAITGIWLFTAITVAIIVCRGESPEINCALALLAVILPVAGCIIYYFASVKHKRCNLKIHGLYAENGVCAAAAADCGTGGAKYEKSVYLKDGTEYFNLLFREIENAERFVYLEYFIVGRGRIFRRMLSALRRAKSRGAEIKLIIDGIGSAFRIGRKERKLLASVGAEIKIFHRLTPFPRSRLNYRDHRKIAVIDGKIAFTGGINIADEYANIDSPYGYWKDTGVAVYGCAAGVFAAMFLSVWHGRYEVTAENTGENLCVPYCDSPKNKSAFLENAYVCAINAAKERVHIFTPYFCVSEKINSALSFAAARGVDVKIIVPHIPDKKYAFEITKAYAAPLAARGVKFYEYTPGFMHAKSMICDQSLYIGSYNMDFRSMRLNYECGIVFDGAITDEAERDFKECMRLSSVFRTEKPSVLRRALRFVLKLFAPLA